MTRYIAESLPAYAVIADWPHRPDTDEGFSRSAPFIVSDGTDETQVRHTLAMDLIHQTANLPAHRQKIFNAASNAIADGVDAVQISGRVYRIRKEC